MQLETRHHNKNEKTALIMLRRHRNGGGMRVNNSSKKFHSNCLKEGETYHHSDQGRSERCGYFPFFSDFYFMNIFFLCLTYLKHYLLWYKESDSILIANSSEIQVILMIVIIIFLTVLYSVSQLPYYGKFVASILRNM